MLFIQSTGQIFTQILHNEQAHVSRKYSFSTLIMAFSGQSILHISHFMQLDWIFRFVIIYNNYITKSLGYQVKQYQNKAMVYI
ncbi:MAG: hypothetical protein A2381_12040 [Bdellovibrionales bacterium RIFOXYB1_FULL_37_110]|nr:MAG: hypothetical protein A2328_04830 [Bdellovibrionales bacterium RIFOXYB2_FULL_36_6]OFZ57214.1 MAG: hypothetical protein A2381_12040 [Bdellovibrionales bacterium RIFOXYB1_FULL_37_110]OFZ65216.1 MAG: hypothetical protein A2577_04475 [Bdellovibrionales bacterium RIFOXYD1_FULL_36_51]